MTTTKDFRFSLRAISGWVLKGYFQYKWGLFFHAHTYQGQAFQSEVISKLFRKLLSLVRIYPIDNQKRYQCHNCS
jgi:hypothetical protein